VLSGLAFLGGYARAAATGTERVPDPEFRSFARRELRRRMLAVARRHDETVVADAAAARNAIAPAAAT
jgi:hypothetical protein